MAAKLKAPRGTYDLLPHVADDRMWIVDVARGLFENAGYRRIETPIFEETELFARGVGEATDIVRKEMYTFEDKGGRSLTLRPEGTAPICRAYIEHGMHKEPQPVKWWYEGPMFRYEAPQAGRYRQHYQIGVEAIGAADPALDAELILLQATLNEELGLDVRLSLSSMGDACCRPAYLAELRMFLERYEADFTAEQLARIKSNPLRSFDWKEDYARAATDAAPKLLDRLCAECRAHLDEVRAYLDAAGAEYELDGRLVRGLDYYTRTVFEFASQLLGAQSGIGGGGRYDHLVEELGGPPTPAAGWATGFDRLFLALSKDPAKPRSRQSQLDVYVAVDDPGRSELKLKAFELVRSLRGLGKSAEFDTVGRGLKSQLKQADRSKALFTVCIHAAANGALLGWVRDMASGEQRDDVAIEQLVKEVAEAVDRKKAEEEDIGE